MSALVATGTLSALSRTGAPAGRRLLLATRPHAEAWTLAQLFQPLIRYFEALASGSWRQMLRATEAQLPEPAFALDERPDAYVFKALIPGAGVRDLAVEVSDHQLRLRGTSALRFTDGKQLGYVRERPVDAAFVLPADARSVDATCAWRHGVVVVTIPRGPALLPEAPPEEPAAALGEGPDRAGREPR